MHSLDDNFHVEIVHVIHNGRLIDYDGVECNYFPDSGQATAPGYYIAIWPYLMVDEPRFTNQLAHFYGPYDLAILARLKVSEHVAEFASLRRATATEPIATRSGHGAQAAR